MTPRENLLRLLRRRGFDSIPVQFTLCPALVDAYHRHEMSKLPYEQYFDFPWREAPRLLQKDLNLTRYHRYHGPLDSATTLDQWGVGHRKTPTSMHMTQMLMPLKDARSAEEIDDYPLPVFQKDNNRFMRTAVRDLKARGHAVYGNMQCTIFETAWYLRGMENLLMDMLSDDPIAERLIARVEETAVARATLYAEAGVDILYVGDDIGMQRTPMMSVELYRQWIMPSLQRVIAAAKAINPEIIILYHSCGFVEPFIPHLIEAGIDVLNPIQPESMDFAAIHAAYGDTLSFHGTIGTQSTMPFGTPEEVREAVFRNLDIAGPDGGLFIAPTHMLEPEVPWANVLAYVEACRKYQG